MSATATVEDSQTLPTPAFSIRVVTSPGSGEPGDTLTFAVEVLQDGTLTQGLTVDFSITSGDGKASLGTPNPATTGNDGQAEIELTLGDSASGSYTITATSNVQICKWDRDSSDLTPTTNISISVISGPGSGAPGEALPFIVEVQQDGTAKEGETVDFSITSGDGKASLGTPNPATTGNDGQAEIELTLGDSASGSYTITATSNGKSVTGTATVTSPPQFSISVISGPGSGAPGEALPFIVEVQQDGTAKEGETVDFSITSGDGKASLGTPNPATTGNDGQAEIELTLGDSASGSYTITATSNGKSVTGTATVTSPPQFSISVISGPGSGAPGEALTFIVEVQQDGTLTQGLTVDFSITSGDGNASLGSPSEQRLVATDRHRRR